MRMSFKSVVAVGVAAAFTLAPLSALAVERGGPTVRGQLAQVSYCLDLMFNDPATYSAECTGGPDYSVSSSHSLGSTAYCDFRTVKKIRWLAKKRPPRPLPSAGRHHHRVPYDVLKRIGLRQFDCLVKPMKKKGPKPPRRPRVN